MSYRKKSCPMTSHLLCQRSEIWPELLPQRTRAFANMFCWLLQGLERHNKSTLHPCLSSTTKEKKGKMMKLILKKYGFAVTAEYTYKLRMPSGPVNLRIIWSLQGRHASPRFLFHYSRRKRKEKLQIPLYPSRQSG